MLKGMNLRRPQYDNLVKVKHRFDEHAEYMLSDVAKLMGVSAAGLYLLVLEEGWPMTNVADPVGTGSSTKRRLISGRFLKRLKKHVTIIKEHTK